jgi:CheY-like chemotaxis protein
MKRKQGAGQLVRRILVVDDDPITLEIARERLEGAGYQVITQEKALGTSLVVHKECPDVVLLDINMPTLSGLKLAGLNVFNGVPFIFHSGKEQAELDRLAAEARALGAIQKTGNAKKFIDAFRVILGRLG